MNTTDASMNTVRIDATVKPHPLRHEVVSVEIRNDSSSAISVRIEQPLVESIEHTDVGFERSKPGRSWKFVDGALAFSCDLDGGERVKTRYAVKETSVDVIADLFEDSRVIVYDESGTVADGTTGIPLSIPGADDRPAASEKRADYGRTDETGMDGSTADGANESIDAPTNRSRSENSAGFSSQSGWKSGDEIAETGTPSAERSESDSPGRQHSGPRRAESPQSQRTAGSPGRRERDDDHLAGTEAMDVGPAEAAHVFAVAGAKGGVGKTTTSINLGTVLAQRDLRTAMVEFDLAMANLVDFLDVDIDVRTDPTFHDVLAGDESLRAATYRAEGGLHLVPSGTSIDGYVNTDLDRLPEVARKLRSKYDVVIFDTPAGMSTETIRPVELADEVVLVSTPRVSAIRNAKNTMEVAERVGTDVRGLVLTMSGTGSSPGADRISEFLGVELLAHVPEDEAIPHSQDRGRAVVAHAPESSAATAYRHAAGELVSSDSSIVDSDSSNVDHGGRTH